MDRGTDGISKTIKVLPKPVQGAAQRVRALMVTGDIDGLRDVSYDDGMVLQGLNPAEMHFYEQQQEAIAARFTAIDEAFYD